MDHVWLVLGVAIGAGVALVSMGVAIAIVRANRRLVLERTDEQRRGLAALQQELVALRRQLGALPGNTGNADDAPKPAPSPPPPAASGGSLSTGEALATSAATATAAAATTRAVRMGGGVTVGEGVVLGAASGGTGRAPVEEDAARQEHDD